MSAMDMFSKGGVVIWVLAALSIYALGVILYKFWQFKTTGVIGQPYPEKILHDLKFGSREQAKQELAVLNGPVARIMATSLTCIEQPNMSTKYKEAEIMRVGSNQLHQLESHMRGLEIAAAIAPLLGLLGTVIGLIDSFSKLGIGSARVDPTMLAGGIWEALLTTAAGLIIAIPALAAHSLFDSWLENLKVQMQDASVQILALEESQSDAASKPVAATSAQVA